MNSRRCIFRSVLIVLISIFTVPVFAGDDIHIVEELDFFISGSTQERSIRKFVDIEEGDRFYSEEALLQVINQEKQDLINYRVYDSVDLKYEEVRIENAIHYWLISYSVVDAFTLIPVPYPKYSTNDGFRLAVQIDYSNAFGTLTDIKFNLGFNVKNNSITGDLEIPEWNFTPEWQRIRISDSVNMVVAMDISHKENEYLSGDIATQYYYSYYRTAIVGAFTWSLPQSWYFRFGPSFGFNFGYEDKGSWGNYDEKPLNLAFTSLVGWGYVNSRNNFRQGHTYALGHTIRYVYSTDSTEKKLTNALDLNGRWYLALGEQLNFYSKLGAFIVFNDVRSGAGQYIRGVANNSMSGETGLYLQNSLAIQFWRWENVWDAQIHPFFDIGMVGNIGEMTVTDNLKYGAGVDLVLYIDALPTLVARATIGFNLSDPELKGLGEKLEIDIASSLSY